LPNAVIRKGPAGVDRRAARVRTAAFRPFWNRSIWMHGKWQTTGRFAAPSPTVRSAVGR